MSFGQQSRLSQLKDRNIYLETDKLYDPLRNALRKSSVSQSHLAPDLSASRVGRNMRSLSPTEAELIKRSLLIPIDKQLVPTRDIKKVMGKSFTAVDFSQTIKQPLTQEQFSRVRLDTTQQIIYEVRNNGESSNIYTSRQNIPNHTFNIGTSRIMGQSKVVAQPNRKSQIKFITQPSQPLRPNLYTQTATKPQGYSFTIKPKESSQKTIPNNNLQSLIRIDKNQYKTSQYLILDRQNSQASINKSMTSIKALRNDTRTKQDISSQTKTIRDNNSKLYQFKSNKTSDRATRLSNRSRSRDEYKYNVYSGLDQQSGTGCNRLVCCTNSQLFSSQTQYNPWK